MKTIRRFLRRLFGPARYPLPGDAWLINARYVSVAWVKRRLVGGVREGQKNMEQWQMNRRDFRDYVDGAVFAARK